MEVWWIKLKLSMFDDEKIKVIESMTGGDTILLIWIKLLVLAGKCNSNGYLSISETLHYTPDMIAAVLGKPSHVIVNALNTFEKFGMIGAENGIISILNWEKHQNELALTTIREQTNARVRRYRERQREAHLTMIEGAISQPVGETAKNIDQMCNGGVTLQGNESNGVTSNDVTQQNKSKNKITVSKDTVSTSKVGDILFSSIKENFLQAYKSHSGVDYYWQAKDAASLKRFIKMLSAQVKSRNQEATASDIADASGYFFASITDAWILEHFSMAVIASKFNEIIAQIRKSHTAQAGTNSRVAHNAGAYASIMNIIDQKYEQSTR